MSGYQHRDRSGGLPYIRRSMPGEGYGGGGQQRGYRPTTAPIRSPVVSPWEGGVVPMAGAMRGEAGDYHHSSGRHYNQDIVGSINQLNQMGNQESEIALNILNAVLNKSGLDTGNQGQGRMSWGGEPRPSKMRRVDWGDGYESQQRWMGPGMQQGARKVPGQSWGEGPRQGWGYSRNTFSGQNRRKLTAKKGNFNTGGKNQNFQKKKKDNPVGKAPVKNQKKKPDAPAGGEATDQKKKDDASAGGGATDQKKKDDAPNVKGAEAESTTTDTKEDLKKETDTKQSETTDAVAVEKETSGDGEKGNQNEADTTVEGKENNESSVTEAGNDNQNKDQNDTLPVEALNCHICVKNFKTPNGYQNHLTGKIHLKLAGVHMQKCDSLLYLIKAQSKLASQQNIVSLRKSKGKITSCHKCECPIKGGMPFHMPLRQHTLVINFNRCSICKIWFDTRGKLENHRLTPQHLKKEYAFEKRIEERNIERAKKMKEEYRFPEIEAMNKVHNDVDQLKLANYNSQAWNPGMIPPYDPAVPIGLNFIERNSQFYCTICSKKILRTTKGAFSHFRSQRHYDNYLTLLKNIEGNEEQLGDKENQADKDPKPAVNEEMEVSEELTSLQEVGENLCDLSENMKETLDSPEQQTQQDEKHSESSEVEASVPTPSESDSNKQPTEKDDYSKSTEKDTVDPNLTEMETEIPKSNEKDTVDPNLTEMETEIPKSTENKIEIPKSTEMETEIPKSTEKKVEIPKSTEKKAETPKSTEKKAETPKSTEKKAEIRKSIEKRAEIRKSAEKRAEIPKSTEKKAEIPKSTEKKAEIPKSTEKKAEILKSTEKKAEIPKSTEKKAVIPKSTDNIKTLQVEEEPEADQEVVTPTASESESTKKKPESKLSTSTPAEKSKSAARPVKIKRGVTTAEAKDKASTTSTEIQIEATEKAAVEKMADIPPRTPRATAKRGRGRGKAGKIKAAKN